MQRDISQTQNHVKSLNSQQEQAQKAHSDLFKSLSLSRDLANPLLARSLGQLDALRDQGKIPNTSIPILEERLASATCICGEALQGENEDAVRRKAHIQHLIEESRRADALQERITQLYFGSLSLQIGSATSESNWQAHLESVWARRDQIDRLRDESGKRLKALETRIAQIPDSDIQGLRDSKRQFGNQRDRFNADIARYQADLDNIKREQSVLSKKRDLLLRQQDKGIRIMADLEVAQDIDTVLSNAYRRLTTEELEKVSSRMNEVFLE